MLTAVELEVLQAAAMGESAAETAGRIQKALGTVRHHRSHVLAKLGARNLTHAVAIAYERHILGPNIGQPRPSHGGQHSAIFAKAGVIERFRRLERHTMVGVALEAGAAHFGRAIVGRTYDEQLRTLTYDEASWTIDFLRQLEAELDVRAARRGDAPPSAMSTGSGRSA